MLLKNKIHIAKRFQRAIRIDSDLGSKESVEGFICPQSSADALLTMAQHVSETQQGAFTWTGPYGSGKSSLVVALGSLLGNSKACRDSATKAVGSETAEKILDSFPPKRKGWQILPVVGRRENPVQVFGRALGEAGLAPVQRGDQWTEVDLVDTLSDVAAKNEKNQGGLIVFIDEMGKFLEGAAQEGGDIYLFQLLAEAASRSNKRLIIVGILHQAFEDYAHHLSREMRDEWSKIQGRFIDLPINVAGEEQIDLLSQAISSPPAPATIEEMARSVFSVIQSNKRGISTTLPRTLASCWPLHPIAACLLGQISRRRFGQNQRSLFGFLNSAEPYGFQDFLKDAVEPDLYSLEHLWEYLRLNQEPSILVSPDGHRWALAVEGVERCESQSSSALHSQLLKSIALIDLFKGSSGLIASTELLTSCCIQYSRKEIEKALEDLRRDSFIIFKKHLGAYAIYAGSDFDIDEATNAAKAEISFVDFSELKRSASLQPILAKRHYHDTGALRWFEVDLVPLKDVVTAAAEFSSKNGTIGQFLLCISTDNENEATAKKLCSQAAKQCQNWDLVIGVSGCSWTINELALEVLSLEKVYSESNELGGDSVARREVRARLADLQGHLETEINKAFDLAQWFYRDHQGQSLSRQKLNVLASDLADSRFSLSPKIHNELLNRIKPSANAIAGQNALLRRMVMNEGQSRLGIEGYPVEGGLFSSILGNPGLYDNETGVFVPPEKKSEDNGNLQPLWGAATEYLVKNSSRSVPVAEIYDVWRNPPFGVRNGLMPVLAVAYILSQRRMLAFYREGIFQSGLRDLDMEILTKDPAAIQLRYMNLSEISKKLLSEMAGIVRELDEKNSLQDLEPIDVARGLVSIYDNVHPWAKRTMHLSRETVRIRNLFKKASDPNKFLFDDIPSLLGKEVDLNNHATVDKIVELVGQGLKELKEAYLGELSRLKEIMLAELQVPNSSPQSLADLRGRAENIKQLSGDFRLEAFVVRLAEFSDSLEDIEGIASLATNKPPKTWIDNDIDRAKVEISDLAQKFIRAETFARVKGRADKRQSLAVVVGINGRPTPVHQDFEVVDSDLKEIKSLVSEFEKALREKNEPKKDIVLAAIAELSTRYIGGTDSEELGEGKAVS